MLEGQHALEMRLIKNKSDALLLVFYLFNCIFKRETKAPALSREVNMKRKKLTVNLKLFKII